MQTLNLHPVEHNPASISIADTEFARELDFK